MQEELQGEAKADADLYEKLTCWCASTGGAKDAAVAEAQSAIAALESEVEARGKAGEQLTAEIAAGEEDAAKLSASLERAEAQRDEEAKGNLAEIRDLRSSLDTIKRAIYVLRQHQAKAFPQLKLTFLERKAQVGEAPDADALSRWMAEHHFGEMSEGDMHRIDAVVATKIPHAHHEYEESELALLRKARKLYIAFTQQGHVGEIFGVMEQMKDDFASQLEELEKTEKQQAAEFQDMAAQLKKALAESERQQKRRVQKAAENAKARADAAQALKDTRTGLDADTKFLVQMKETCAAQDTEWAARTKARQQEIQAVSDALGILANDDATDLMSKSLGKPAALLQLRVTHRRVKARSVARVDLAKFPKVTKAIDDMVVGLEQQQKEEVEHKDWCQSELHSLDMETVATTRARDGLQARVAASDATLQQVAEEVTGAHGEIQGAYVSMQSANADRVAESLAFQHMVADQRATVDVLYKAIDKLAAVYEPATALLQVVPTATAKAAKAPAKVAPTAAAKAAKAPSKAPAKAAAKAAAKAVAAPAHGNVTALVQGKQQPPGQFKEYKQHGGSGSVLVLLRGLVKDAQDLEAEATSDENKAIVAYAAFVSETNEVVAALQRKVVSLTERKASVESELATDQHALTEAGARLEGLAKQVADTHKACDFVLDNFDTRQEARQQEITGLKQAKSILAGAK